MFFHVFDFMWLFIFLENLVNISTWLSTDDFIKGLKFNLSVISLRRTIHLNMVIKLIIRLDQKILTKTLSRFWYNFSRFYLKNAKKIILNTKKNKFKTQKKYFFTFFNFPSRAKMSLSGVLLASNMMSPDWQWVMMVLEMIFSI